MKHIFHWAGLAGIVLACLLLVLSGATEAARQAPVHELNYFQTSKVKVDGRDALRIEIGMDHRNLEYAVSARTYLNRQLVVDMENTVQGELRNNISLDSSLARSVKLSEAANRHMQVRVTLTHDVDKANYKVYTVEADRQARKPYRLVIDILEPQAAGTGTAAVAGLAGHTIVLDPGHGGSDSGAIGATGVMEKNVTLSVAKKVSSILEQSGAKTIMTRKTDVDVYAPNDSAVEELQARCDVANNAPGAQLFISIHCNAFSNPSASGMESYYYEPSADGARLAQLLNEELEKAGGLLNRGVKTANFYVIKHTNIPASLVELGFITNNWEEQQLNSEDYQNKLAAAIVRAIARYFN